MKVSLLTSRYVHIKTWGSIFNISVRSALLYGQCWAITRLICGVKHSHRLSVDPLYNRLGIEPLSTLLRLRCFSWFGHVSLNEGWIRHCFCLDVVGLPTKNMGGSHWGWLKSLKINRRYYGHGHLERCCEKCCQSIQPLFHGKKTLNWISKYCWSCGFCFGCCWFCYFIIIQ